MENVVSIKLEDFLEIRDRVLELEQELDNAYNEAQELRNSNFELKKYILKYLTFFKSKERASLEEFSSIDNIYSVEVDKLHKLGFTDVEIVSFLELIWREHQESKEEQEC